MLPLMGRPAPDAPVTVTREVFDSAMLPNRAGFRRHLQSRPARLRDGVRALVGTPVAAPLTARTTSTDCVAREGRIAVTEESLYA
jgi:hypothetical protein